MTQKNIKISSNRSFGIVFFIVFLLIGIWPILNGGEIRYWAIFISLIFLVLGAINSNFLTPLNRIWFKFGLALGNFIAPIIMGVVFFLVVTPIGILMKLLRKDLINLKMNKDKTYWIEKKEIKTSMKNQF